ncbi:nucleolar zinc-finger protein [Clydaea vesicula]|uniref:Nucleolar zinc-finger protein n=1 Tax=Clydaea vesicula TaxID=447962 RepID=A0AAD5Y022_9FUNG|nr:nucleolar zinc-finger protein [Clydaea vesicula]
MVDNPTEQEQELQPDSDGIIRRHNLFENLDGEQTVNETESLCMNCHDNGTTRFLITKIPHFKEVVIMAFECPHCFFQNNEIQSASMIQEKGQKITIKVKNKLDLNRQLVKSEKSILIFPDLELTIAPSGGSLTTVEGAISKAVQDLTLNQPQRLEQDYSVWQKVQEVIGKLKIKIEQNDKIDFIPFEMVLDDPSGNSFCENLCAPNKTTEQDESLGIMADANNVEADGLDLDLQHEVHTFFGNCSRCEAACDTKMHMLEIPHFKDVIVMSTVCDACGYKSNEIKSGGAISPKGKRITLKMTENEDLSRDILKSETCGLKIPEVDLELAAGTLGGRFTTVEGLLKQIYEELDQKAAFRHGDGVDPARVMAFDTFLSKLKKVLNMEQEFTLILDDPLSNSYLQNVYAPDEDPNMTTEFYERSWEENEAWGLNDIKVENYENDV